MSGCQLTTEERLYLHAARMGDYGLLREILESAELCLTMSGEVSGININCVDYMGRNALHLAVDSENAECIELLLDRLNWECQEEVDKPNCIQLTPISTNGGNVPPVFGTTSTNLTVFSIFCDTL